MSKSSDIDKSGKNEEKITEKQSKFKKESDKPDDNEINNESETHLEEVDEDLESNNSEEYNKIKDQLLRALAENENLRKRTEKDIEQIKKYGHIFFVRDLLSSVDNLTRAVEAVPIDKEKLDEPVKNLIVGVEIVLDEINSFLEKNNISKINPLGEKFDYNFHQAMYEAPSKKFEPGTVLEVVQTGYLLHDRLIRPAMVGISKKENLKDETQDNDKNI